MSTIYGNVTVWLDSLFFLSSNRIIWKKPDIASALLQMSSNMEQESFTSYWPFSKPPLLSKHTWVIKVYYITRFINILLSHSFIWGNVNVQNTADFVDRVSSQWMKIICTDSSSLSRFSLTILWLMQLVWRLLVQIWKKSKCFHTRTSMKKWSGALKLNVARAMWYHQVCLWQSLLSSHKY